MAPSRRSSRKLALQALYEMEMGAHDPRQVLRRLVEEAGASSATAEFAALILDGVLRQRQEIDDLIAKTAPAWPASQLASVDRNILRIAIRECILDNLTPVGAAVNEAVELAKIFGSENSARFINGVLGSLTHPHQAAAQEGQ